CGTFRRFRCGAAGGALSSDCGPCGNSPGRAPPAPPAGGCVCWGPCGAASFREIPDLFPDDEVENIINSVRNEVKGRGLVDSRETCWKFFIERVRRQLKIQRILEERTVRNGLGRVQHRPWLFLPSIPGPSPAAPASSKRGGKLQKLSGSSKSVQWEEAPGREVVGSKESTTFRGSPEDPWPAPGDPHHQQDEVGRVVFKGEEELKGPQHRGSRAVMGGQGRKEGGK
ncbi:uncharacterized protein, partial [Patagioenas fasciata]|uniref:uncharacterized protein n=1 Tax=Patagioenas fasciata TaxID=372321 RepID=UPI003A9983A9